MPANAWLPTIKLCLLHGGPASLLRGGDVALARADVQRFGQQFGHSRRHQIPYQRCLAVLAQWNGDNERVIEHLTIAATLARRNWSARRAVAPSGGAGGVI